MKECLIGVKRSKTMREVTIRVELDGDYMDIPYEVEDSLTEDETFEECIEYAMSNLAITII